MKRLFNSPTLMTIFSLSSKSLSFILITPFLLSNFSTEQIALWYLLGIFINMQALADFGFYNTFVRVIALSLSGGCSCVKDLNNIECESREIKSANIELAGRLIGTMKRIYSILTILLFCVFLVLSPLLYKNVIVLENPNEGWFSWGIVILFSIVNFLGRPYSNFLLAQNKVALVRRWEGLFNLIALCVNIAVVVFVQSLFLLVLSNQIWILVNVFRNRYLANHISSGYQYKEFIHYKYDTEVMHVVWPLAWRAGLSSFTTQGIVSASGLIYAQFSSATSASSYLFAEKLFTAMRSFSQAPFYSKIPLLVILRGQGKLFEWESLAQRGMCFASLIMVFGIIIFDLLGADVFFLIKSNVDFPDHILWLLMGWAYLLHRYGAMHTQLYSTINKVNSHISDLISGLIMIVFWIFFIDKLGVYVFPLGMLSAYLLFYVWYSGYYSYRLIQASIIEFEIKANIIPFVLFIIYSIFRIVLFLCDNKNFNVDINRIY